RAERALAGVMTFAIAAHASGGGYGAYHRWEMYIVAATLITVLWLERRPIRALADRASPVRVGAMAGAWCLVLAGRYIFGLSTVPLAANNIFEQQYQMHRFVTQFERRPVAANDIGWVSYRNLNVVLDLVGLGSEGFVSDDGGAVRVEALQRAVENRRIEVAMLYDEWVPQLPPGWRRMGELRLSRPKITPAFETVAFYATGVGSYEDALRRWESFRATLPPRVGSMSGTDSTRAE
ncbi:MAG TPA: hypothetical protein VFT93_08400, partial [Candidatus Eisenbacteria bacterium]|nr:hypothetical protein [Candidatus Eisenbacteria bacterium]